MTTRRWLVLTIAITVATAGGIAAANAAIDIYGLFRNPAGRSLPLFGDERVAKYLFGVRYVPANFDGALVGTSVSANWNVGAMRPVRLYNESVNGGNIVEEKAILERLMERWTPRLVVLVVHPYITASHEFKTVELTPSLVRGALGSQNLVDAYKNALKIRLGREPQLFDASGTEDFGDQAKPLNPDMQAMLRPGQDFAVDPIARQAYRDVVNLLHARQVPVAFVVPPTSEPLFRPKRDAFTRYIQDILADRAPGDQVLDFSSDEFAAFRVNESLYSDGVHLRASGAPKVTAVLEARIQQWMGQGWLARQAAGLPVRPPKTPVP